MRFFSVKEVAELSGVSIRTLHYYDQTGLLKPSNRTEVGYRKYGEQELLRLQQILFFKELDFKLKDIQELLDEPDFNRIAALESHKSALFERQKRITQLIDTINKTINHLKNEQYMSGPEQLYEGLPKEFGTSYRQEAIDKYGKAKVRQSEEALLKQGKQGFEQLKLDFEQVNSKLFELHNEKPESEKVQHLISQHYLMIRKFWGTSHKAEKQGEAYAGLGDLYVADPRFTAREGEPQPAFAQFLQKAMRYFADTQLLL